MRRPTWFQQQFLGAYSAYKFTLWEPSIIDEEPYLLTFYKFEEYCVSLKEDTDRHSVYQEEVALAYAEAECLKFLEHDFERPASGQGGG